jgi:dethiobiotin synthetase
VLRGIFVTGTDTGVGKTVACAALMHYFRSQSRPRYWKPIQTGIEQDDDTAEVRRLSGCDADSVLSAGVRLRRPVSPHLAAQLSGTSIDIAALLRIIEAEVHESPWIVEGAGGVLVPLNDSTLMIDFMTALALPVLIVARSGLGTINHTLLTIAALRDRALRVAGVLMVGEPNAANRAAIERYGSALVVGELPRLEPLTPESLGDWAAAGLRLAL